MTDDGVSNKDFLARVLAGWDDIEGANGEPLAFNGTNLERLAGIGYLASAVADAYAAFSMDLPAKNSKPPRAH